MKARTIVVSLAALLLSASVCLAAGKIPNLVGTWKSESMGGAMIHEKGSDQTTHWVENQKALVAEVTIISQDGRFVAGIFKSDKASEKFIGMISADGKSVHFADTDGHFDGKIVNNNTVEILYRHVKSTSTVVAMGTWKRKK